MFQGFSYFAYDRARVMQLCLIVLAASLSSSEVWSQIATQSDAAPGVDDSTLAPNNQVNDNPESQPTTTQARRPSTKQPNAGVPEVPLRNSIQQATDAGLEPTLSNGLSTAATANGIVPSFPGLTSFGGQAAAAAANSPKFLTYYASQALSYSDNPGQIAAGQSILSSTFLGLNRPDFYEVTSGGVLLSKTISRQNFFASANFGITNYAHDTNFNSTQYSLSIGDNYVISDTCAGTIVANQSVSAVPLEFTVGSLSSQNTENTSGEINTRCRIYKNIFFTGNVTASRNSFTNAQVFGNNSNQMLGSVGAEYAVPSFVTAGILASIQETSFTGRNTLLLAALPNKTSQVNFNVYINKPITPKLNVALSGGITDLSSGAASLGGSIQPIFSASINYAYSPKTGISLSYARATGSPQTFVADFQQIETISAGLSYRFSPKISISASASHSTTTSSSSFAGAGGFSNIINPVNLAFFAANTTTTSEQIAASYLISQRASASLAYQHTTRDGYLLGQAAANIVSLSLSYRH